MKSVRRVYSIWTVHGNANGKTEAAGTLCRLIWAYRKGTRDLARSVVGVSCAFSGTGIGNRKEKKIRSKRQTGASSSSRPPGTRSSSGSSTYELEATTNATGNYGSTSSYRRLRSYSLTWIHLGHMQCVCTRKSIWKQQLRVDRPRGTTVYMHTRTSACQDQLVKNIWNSNNHNWSN